MLFKFVQKHPDLPTITSEMVFEKFTNVPRQFVASSGYLQPTTRDKLLQIENVPEMNGYEPQGR